MRDLRTLFYRAICKLEYEYYDWHKRKKLYALIFGVVSGMGGKVTS